VLSQTCPGYSTRFKTRVPMLAAHVDAQVALRTRLRRERKIAYAAHYGFDEGTRDGRLLVGEVLARWHDYAVSGDLGTALRASVGIGAGAARRQADSFRRGAHRYARSTPALRAALQSLTRLGRGPRGRAGCARLARYPPPAGRRAARRPERAGP